ncbi:tubby-related protein 4-like [Panonychus citri]|uniref:tubby-related protein 4-like n=1 Tax=Panonychus citri TaxID=50023 RepID=UPI002306F0A9|nr:tubby-related protein 4-like [Panonychus citri]
MHLHFERIEKPHSYSDCNILSLSWMGKVPAGLLQSQDEDSWKLNRTNYYQDGWIALGTSRGIVGVTFTTCRTSKLPALELPPRTNYNLRGHRSEVTLVKWNEPYQKLASCDSSGIIFVWIKYEGRWSVELINDRNTQVIDFAWSHDGRMALICYIDGFVLIGSVAGQRYWSSLLNLESCSTTCGIWTPDDQQVIFGTSNGSILVIDINGTIVAQLSIREHHSILSMAWSSEKFKMEDIEEENNTVNRNTNNYANNVFTNESDQSDQMIQGSTNGPSPRVYVLSICFDDGILYLLKNYDDICPITVRTNLNTIKMEWSNKGDILAVGGHTIEETNPNNHGNSKNSNYLNSSSCTNTSPKYINMIKLYSEIGLIRYQVKLDYTGHPISALTWGHNDKRLFVGTGPVLHIAWVTKKIAPLHLLCRLSIYKRLTNETAVDSLPLPNCLQNLVVNLFGRTLRCYLPDNLNLTKFNVNPPVNNTRLYCTLIRHDEDSIGSSSSYVLYLEYLGGLVPILKGKRTSKIRPEFVIFHPQSQLSGEGLKIESRSRFKGNSESTSGYYSDSGLNSRSQNRKGQLNTLYWNSTSTPGTSDSENEDNSLTIRVRRRRRQHRGRRNQGNEENDINRLTRPGSDHVKPESTYADSMPEDEKLTLITSNIWGTKFKILGLVPWLPSNLGSVAYRTSLLHLQPRQMTLKIKELGGKREGVIGGFEGLDRNVTSSDDEDENMVAGSTSFERDCAIPVAPMTPKKTLRNHSSRSHPISNYDPIRSETLDHNYVDLLTNLSEDLLTLHVNGNSNFQQMPSMELAPASSTSFVQSSGYNNRATIKSITVQPPPTSSSISTQTSFQSLTDILNPLILMTNEKPTVQMLTENNLENIQSDSKQSCLNDFCSVSKSSTDCYPGPSTTNSNSWIAFDRDDTLENAVPTLRTKKSSTFEIKSPPQLSSPTATFPMPSNSIGLISTPRSLHYNNKFTNNNRDPLTRNTSRPDPIGDGGKAFPLICDTNHSNTNNCYKLPFVESGRNGAINHIHHQRSASPPKTISSPTKWFSSSSNPHQYKNSNSYCELDDCLVEGKHIHTSNTGHDIKFIDDAETESEMSLEILSPSTGSFGRSPSLLFYRNHSSIAQTQPNSSSTIHGSFINSQQANDSNYSHNSNNNIREIIEFANIRSDPEGSGSSQRRYILSTNKRSSLEDESDDELNVKSNCLSFDGDHCVDGKGLTLSSSFCKCTTFCKCTDNEDDHRNHLTVNGNSLELNNDHRSSLMSSPVHVRRRKVFLNFDSEELLNSLNDCSTLLAETFSTSNQLGSRGNGLNGSRGGPRTGHRGSLPQAVAPNESESFYKSFRSQLFNRSLPTSPMLNSSKSRKSQGKSIFYSPTMFRKVMKQKLNYFDCSSEDDGSSDDEFLSQDFRNLGSFQKSSIEKKIKVKRRSSRIQPDQSINQRHSGGREFLLHNKAPLWNEVSQVYQLDFGGRVTQESAKNFQIEHQGKQVMQFGRIDDNAYTLDFQYPFSALQALAVALANVTQRLK